MNSGASNQPENGGCWFRSFLRFGVEVIAHGHEASPALPTPGMQRLVRDGYCGAHQPKRTTTAARRPSPGAGCTGQTSGCVNSGRDSSCGSFCRECSKRGIRTRATDVDHIVDHKGDWDVFCDPSNLESLCHSCHSRKTARELWQNRTEKRRR